ncbi:hypothetical protein ES705_41692 [subsurface metagenome]
MNYIEQHKSVLFDDLENAIEEIKGTVWLLEYKSKKTKNVFVWQLSDIGSQAIIELLNEKKLNLKPNPTTFGVLSYMAGGGRLELPLADEVRHYEEPHWLPCSIGLYDYIQNSIEKTINRVELEQKLLEEQKKLDKKNPIIGGNGLYPNQWGKKPPENDILIPEEKIQLCKEWIQEYGIKTDEIIRDYSSYGLKHKVEDVKGSYVSNGSFIKATIELGYDFERTDYNSPNTYFNMNIKKY